jgi:hypothetical protein
MHATNTYLRSTLVLIIAFSAASVALTQDNREDAYQKHLEKVRQLLPPHSALPPLLDLSEPNANGGGASRDWEDRFTGSMGVREHADPGMADPSGKGSISMTTTEYGGPTLAIPARNCDVVILARPITSNVHMAYNHRFVYSMFTVEISEVLKGQGKRGIRQGEQITLAQLGGAVRFPSGHLETFLLDKEGFMQLGQRYAVFAWKPLKFDSTYMADELYLVQNDVVFPVNLDAHESTYSGMPFTKFLAKVKAAIAENINTN